MKTMFGKLIKKGMPFVGMVLLGGTAQAAFLTGFDVPPYTLNATVVGVEGWSTYGASSGSTNALVVTSPMDASDTVMRLKKSASADASVRIKNNSFTAFTGTVAVDVGMAFNFSGSSGTVGVVAFADLSNFVSPLSFGMDFRADLGGLYYSIGSTKYILLGTDDVKANSIYHFSLVMDLPNHLFDLFVTGVLADDSPLNFSISDQAFSGLAGDALSTIYMETNAKPAYTTYVDSVAIANVPEPLSAVLFPLGLTVIGLPRRRRNSGTADEALQR